MGAGPLAKKELSKRRDYSRDALDESSVDADPIAQFGTWLDVANESTEIDEPLAMTVATADHNGVPSARIVLLRGFDENGFVFYTNYLSHKGRDLAENAHAALVFYWGPLERQIRVEGTVGRVPASESDEYFASRPFKSRLGAVASDQSSVVESRDELDAALATLQARYSEDDEVPRPDHWGGFRVVPNMIEFWQGRRSRMHDRLQYSRQGNDWKLERLSP